MVKSSKSDNEKVRGVLTALAGEGHKAAENLMKPCAVVIAPECLVNGRKRNLIQFSYLIILWNVAFKIW
jgi:hypothetical protein